MSTAGMSVVQDRIAAIEGRFRAVGPMPVGGRNLRTAAAESSFATTLAAAGTTSAAPAGVDGEAVVAAARRYLGVPYRWGGAEPETGLDCSGFVQRTFADLGIELPRVSADQATVGTPVASLAEARPGDLLAFDISGARPGIDHIGIYAGDGTMLVAPRTGDVVRLQQVTREPVAIRRVIGSGRGRSGAFASLFAEAGARHGVDPALLQAVARHESGFDPTAVSRAGALGLMQLMPATATSLGVDPLDPAQAVDGAARLLGDHLRRFGSVPLALAAYNAGPGAVTRHGGIPPYAETQRYVGRIMNELEEGR